MNKSASIWMAVLTITAVILASILLSSNSRPAQAAMLNAQPTVTLITTGTVQNVIPGQDVTLVYVDGEGNEVAVQVLPTTSSWFGVTYREDRPQVVAALTQLVQSGQYPNKLWS